MKIALAQINTIIGDFEGNAAKIINNADSAREIGAELCVFPEQCIPGYPAHDLLERTRFIDQNSSTLSYIADKIRGIGVIVGFAEQHNGGIGKGLYNSAALIEDGKIISIHRKSLLPTYDVFDESRYFDAAPSVNTVDFHGIKLGITICEDVWNDPDFWQRRLYELDPSEALIRQGAEIIINVAASPFTIVKRTLRKEMLRAYASHHGKSLLFVNSVGGNDDLVFDGGSRVYSSDGSLQVCGKDFEEDLILFDADAKPSNMDETSESDESAALKALILGTRDYGMKCGFSKGLVGLSGGIDSALVVYIGAMAFGPENMEALLMPSPYSSQGSITDSIALAENLGIEHHIVPINTVLEDYLATIKPVLGSETLGVTEENLQARIRGNMLMAVSNYKGNLLLSTGNKSEMATGYCTLYGDMAGGLAVISDLPKTMVYRLCEYINRDSEIIPRAIIDKPPSAELRPDQKDSDSLPAYDILDQVLNSHIVDRQDHQALISQGFDPDMVNSILRMVRNNEYKRRQAPPGIKLTSKAFGFGRRIPLAQKWRP